MSSIILHAVSQTTTDQTVKEAVTTVEPIRHDNTSAELQHAPEWNELDTDESGELVGLSPRVVGSDTIDTDKYAPWWADFATENHNEIIDNQVASSGTAAARELAGEQGHGTMQYAIGIEPVIRPGAEFGNDYFLSNPSQIQEGAGLYMSPTWGDQWVSAVNQRNATLNSRQAYDDTMFAALIG
jgi:hypothetical protein